MPIENLLPANADTLLSISSMGTMLYQARGLTQSLQVIQDSVHMERTINGTLIDVSAPQFRKYITHISASDVDAPPLDNVWPGMTVTIYCACSLAYATGNPGSPARAEVSGSSWVQGAYTFYRPVLVCLVRSVTQHFDEWKAVNGWTLEAEEI
jgi:hypothetical protein